MQPGEVVLVFYLLGTNARLAIEVNGVMAGRGIPEHLLHKMKRQTEALKQEVFSRTLYPCRDYLRSMSVGLIKMRTIWVTPAGGCTSNLTESVSQR